MECKIGWDSCCSLHLGNRKFGELPILQIAGIKGRRKLKKLYQMETDVANWTLFKPISIDFLITLGYEINFNVLMQTLSLQKPVKLDSRLAVLEIFMIFRVYFW